MNCWIYKGECLQVQPTGFVGYIYLITNLVDNRIYIGKKQFSVLKKTKISKRTRRKTGSRKRVNFQSVDSQWLNYWSSSLELQEDVKKLEEDKFRREIIHLCKSKAELTYYEGFYQYKYNVLFVPSYNKWIFIRARRANLITKDKT